MKFLSLTLLAIMFFTGCASKSVPSATGFLDSYADLKPLELDKTHLVSKNKDINLSRYSKLYIPEVKVISLTEQLNPYDRELFTQISAYSTASYKKLISKKSSNYKLVGVGQKDTLIIEVALSMVEGDDISNAKPLAFAKNTQTQEVYTQGDARLLVEVKTRDAMTNEVLVRSMRLINQESIKVSAEHIRFKDLQTALDAWLGQLLK